MKSEKEAFHLIEFVNVRNDCEIKIKPNQNLWLDKYHEWSYVYGLGGGEIKIGALRPQIDKINNPLGNS